MIRNLLLTALVWAVSAHPAAAEVQALPALGAAAGDTSVSGISSGAYMAGQYQFAHARSVMGAAIIAGGPFGCAEARYGSFLLPPTRLAMNASQSVNGCMLNALSWYGIPDPAALAEQARDLSAAGKIDPIDALKRHRVYMFSGAADQIVHHDVVVAAAEVYLRLGVAKAQIKTGPQLEAGHGFVTEQEGSACARSAAPYVVKCGYDQAGDLLAHIYGPLLPKGAAPLSDFITFDQRRFTAGSSAGLAETGAAYIPSECRARPGCRIHIAFHGCQQARAVAGDAFIAGSGYAGWAEANRIIVLFPQVAPEPLLNPLGCWDWWGYTGFEYLTKSAPQIAAVHSMVERLTSRAP